MHFYMKHLVGSSQSLCLKVIFCCYSVLPSLHYNNWVFLNLCFIYVATFLLALPVSDHGKPPHQTRAPAQSHPNPLTWCLLSKYKGNSTSSRFSDVCNLYQNLWWEKKITIIIFLCKVFKEQIDIQSPYIFSFSKWYLFKCRYPGFPCRVAKQYLSI